MFYVYVHKKPCDLTIFYVGKGQLDRLNSRKSRNKHWWKIVNEFGFVPEIIKRFDIEEDALNYEKELIIQLKYDGFVLCNMTSGGQGTSGLLKSKEDRARLSLIAKRFFSIPENREKFSNITKERMRDEEERMKVSAGLKKYFANPESRKKLSDTAKQRIYKNPNLLILLKNQAEKMKIGVYCENHDIEFDSVSSARDWMKSIGFLKAQTSAISRVCNGSKQSYLGLRFKYI